jgi:hypothetical protein
MKQVRFPITVDKDMLSMFLSTQNTPWWASVKEYETLKKHTWSLVQLEVNIYFIGS